MINPLFLQATFFRFYNKFVFASRKRTLKTKEGFTGRKQNKRSEFCCLPVNHKNPSFPGHAPGKDTLRAANAATERGSTGENARANAVSGRALSPVRIKIPVASADMRRHSDTLRGAQRRRKRGLRGENRISVSEFCCLPVIPRKGANGGKREGERSEQESVVTRPPESGG